MSKLNKQFFRTVEEDHDQYERAYRELITGSNEALRRSKRAIFAFHRGGAREGKALLTAAAKQLRGFETEFRKQPLLRSEGVYRAALEEFVEAHLYAQFLTGKPIGAVTGFKTIDPDIFLGGLSDLTGEIVRYAVVCATKGDTKEVMRAEQTLAEVIAFLISLDLTGKLRTKFDQAKNSSRRMEQIVYDLSMKR